MHADCASFFSLSLYFSISLSRARCVLFFSVVFHFLFCMSLAQHMNWKLWLLYIDYSCYRSWSHSVSAYLDLFFYCLLNVLWHFSGHRFYWFSIKITGAFNVFCMKFVFNLDWNGSSPYYGVEYAFSLCKWKIIMLLSTHSQTDIFNHFILNSFDYYFPWFTYEFYQNKYKFGSIFIQIMNNSYFYFIIWMISFLNWLKYSHFLLPEKAEFVGFCFQGDKLHTNKPIIKISDIKYS